MFTAALFTKPKWGKQPKCPSTDEFLNKICYTLTMSFYLAIIWNEVVIRAEIRMNLGNIMIHEKS